MSRISTVEFQKLLDQSIEKYVANNFPNEDKQKMIKLFNGQTKGDIITYQQNMYKTNNNKEHTEKIYNDEIKIIEEFKKNYYNKTETNNLANLSKLLNF